MSAPTTVRVIARETSLSRPRNGEDSNGKPTLSTIMVHSTRRIQVSPRGFDSSRRVYMHTFS